MQEAKPWPLFRNTKPRHHEESIDLLFGYIKWALFLQEPHNLFIPMPLSSDLQLHVSSFYRKGKSMSPALTDQMPICCLISSHSCSLLPSDLQFRIPLCCLLGVMLIFIVSQWLSEEIWEISMNFPFLTFFSMPSSFLVLARGKLLLIPKGFGL